MSSKEAAANMTNKDATRQIIAAADEAIAALLFHQPRPHCLLRSRLSWLDLWCPFGQWRCDLQGSLRRPRSRHSAGPFNDLAALEKALSTRDVAAFIVEPTQGKGVNLLDDIYLRGVQALCRKYGIAIEHWGVDAPCSVARKATPIG